MKIEIWSDIMCPFCYIGKRHLEQAMESLPFKNEVEIEWKSYQLNPDYHNTNNESFYAYLSRAKGMSVDQVKQLSGSVSEMANNVGLSLSFDKNIPANSFNAHRLIHFAKTKGMQDQAEEALFHAHFMEGKDIAQLSVLIELGEQIGLNKNEVEKILLSDEFTEAVRYDVYESKQIGVGGVPYFVFDRKFALSGAQPVEAFVAAITQSFTEWKVAQPKSELKSLNKNDGAVCDENGCEL